MTSAKRAPRARRRPNHRLVKIHRSYTVDEASKALGVAKETIRRWLKRGALPALTDRIPTLILGGDLSDFLQARSAKRPKLPVHQCYCFKCRGPRAPALGMADYIPRTHTTGTLRALCEACLTVMNKVVSASAIAELEAVVELSIQQAEQHLIDTSQSCLNDNSHEEPQSHA
ncbi:MAG: helix-turn-helix domain-containing protein [Devosia sp.]